MSRHIGHNIGHLSAVIKERDGYNDARLTRKDKLMTDSVTAFYNAFAPEYTAIFQDWQRSVGRQADVLAAMIERLQSLPSAETTTVLDVTCGIGTQAIGLATKGYRVHGTDISPDAIAQARQNVDHFDVPVRPTFEVANLLQPPRVTKTYDVVLSADNSIAHFLTDTDLRKALTSMLLQLKSGGLLMLSLRDYDRLVMLPPRSTEPIASETPNGRRVTFQLWNWDDNHQTYAMEQFILRQVGNEWQTTQLTTQLRAWQRDDLEEILLQQGLNNITWHMPKDSGYYQPIVSALKPDW